jgi:hypothetical protein
MLQVLDACRSHHISSPLTCPELDGLDPLVGPDSDWVNVFLQTPISVDCQQHAPFTRLDPEYGVVGRKNIYYTLISGETV